MMDACPLETWAEIVKVAVSGAKLGNPVARAWLGRYLLGDPATKAPAPTTVLVQQVMGQEDRALCQAIARELDSEDVPFLLNDGALQQARAMLEG